MKMVFRIFFITRPRQRCSNINLVRQQKMYNVPRNTPLNQRGGKENESKFLKRAVYVQHFLDLFGQMCNYIMGSCFQKWGGMV